MIKCSRKIQRKERLRIRGVKRDNIKLILKKQCNVIDFLRVTQDRKQWHAVGKTLVIIWVT